MTVVNYMVFSTPSYQTAENLTKLVKKAIGRNVQAYQWKAVPLNLIEVEVAPADTPPSKDHKMRVNLVVDTSLHHKLAMVLSEIVHGDVSEQVNYNDLASAGLIVTQSNKTEMPTTISNRISLDIARLVMTRFGIRYMEAVGDLAAAGVLARRVLDDLGIKPQVNDFKSDWDGSY